MSLILIPSLLISLPDYSHASDCSAADVSSWSISFANSDGQSFTVGPIHVPSAAKQVNTQPLAPIDVSSGGPSWFYHLSAGTLGNVTYNYWNQTVGCTFSTVVPIKNATILDYSSSKLSSIQIPLVSTSATFLSASQNSGIDPRGPLDAQSPVYWDPYLYITLVSADGCIKFPSNYQNSVRPNWLPSSNPPTSAAGPYYGYSSSLLPVTFQNKEATCQLDVYALNEDPSGVTFPDPNITSGVETPWNLSKSIIYFGKWKIKNPSLIPVQKTPVPTPSTSKLTLKLPKAITIVCFKGKLLQKITSIKPKCSVGYQQKK